MKAPVTVTRLAQETGHSSSTIRKWIRAGKLQACSTPGGHYKIPYNIYMDFMKSQGYDIEKDKK